MIQDRVCRECGHSFKGGPRAYYCPACRVERKKEAKRQYEARARLGTQRKLGSKDKCERCGIDYTVESGLQRFCPECQPIHNAEYDRMTALDFYHDNKERINPPRKLKRRKNSNICVMCGNVFEPINGSTTCSPKCKRLLANKRNRDARKKERDKNG